MQILDIMVDLETLGTAPGCVVLSIGAVAFDPWAAEPLGPEFYAVLNLADSQRMGLTVDPQTEQWWLRQDLAAKQVLRQAQLKTKSLRVGAALRRFDAYLIKTTNDVGAARIWGNGAAFDNALLSAVYRAAGRPQPWAFWNDRCYRTLKGLAPAVKLERMGTYHNALDDAKSQALHACKILQQLHAPSRVGAP